MATNHVHSLGWPQAVSRENLAHGYVLENKFFAPSKADARFKLEDSYGLLAWDLLLNKLEYGESVSVKNFINEYCHPMWELCRWVKVMQKEFGAVATRMPSFWNIVGKLKTEGGRQSILACLRDRTPLHGSGGHIGIEDMS